MEAFVYDVGGLLVDRVTGGLDEVLLTPSACASAADVHAVDALGQGLVDRPGASGDGDAAGEIPQKSLRASAGTRRGSRSRPRQVDLDCEPGVGVQSGQHLQQPV